MTLLNSVQPEKYFLDLDCISRFVKKQFLPVYFKKDRFSLNRTSSPKALSKGPSFGFVDKDASLILMMSVSEPLNT